MDREYKRCQDFWLSTWNRLDSPKGPHGYMESKGFSHNFGAKVVNFRDEENNLYPNTLCVPIYNCDKELCGVQRIFWKDGWQKRNFSGTKLKGSYYSFGDWETAKTLYLCEGFATGASVFENMHLPVVCVFSANNLPNVAKTIRKHNPNCTIIVAADNDKTSRAGEIWANRALEEIKTACIVKVAQFPQGVAGSDYNDLARINPQLLKDQLSIEQISPEDEFRHLIDMGFTEYCNNKMQRLSRELMRFFYRKYHYRYIEDIQKIIIWKNGLYQRVPDNVPKKFAEEYYHNPKCLNDKERVEFLKLCQVNYTMSSMKEFFDPGKTSGKINFSNGIYDLNKKELLPHDPKWSFQYILPFPYEEGGECPTMDKFLQAFSCGREKTTRAIWEYIGLIISGDSPIKFKKALILDGLGENGKSTLINIIKVIVGEQNCSSVSIADIPDNRFSSSEMVGKLVNFAEEEPPSLFTSTGKFKAITGGSPIFTERKGEPGEIAVIIAKLIITYNEMPPLSDGSRGMKKRLLVIPCNQDYAKNSHLKITCIEEKIRAEAPAILFHAIEAMKRLVKQGHFTEIPGGKEKIQEMLENGCPTYKWASNYLGQAIDSKGRPVLSGFREFYEHYCRTIDLLDNAPITHNMFSKKLKIFLKNSDFKCEIGRYQIRDSKGKWEKRTGVQGVGIVEENYGR